MAEKYQGIKFHVIFYEGEDNNLNQDIINALETKDINTHKLSSILKDDFENAHTSLYTIPHDGHPAPLMHKTVAYYVVNEIIGKNVE